MGQCSACGGENRDGASFCASCGGSLSSPCPVCGNVPLRTARFCDSCGSALEAPAVAAPSQARKVVTLLFADLVGSTGAQEQMDPESVRRGMDRFYAAMRAAIEAHGGRVVKFIGDGVMAAFGVPDVREDDARRALAAASAMQEAVANLGDAANVALRIGINTGEVVVSADDDDVVGDAVNVAARLEQAAGPGEVVVGETTWRLVRFTARLRALPPLELKGKADLVQAFQLMSLEPVVDTSITTPFIGRTAELGRLLTVLDDAIRTQRARLVTIVGSPGVGKTRLARELATAAAARARVIEMRCDPAAGLTFGPIAEALRSAASLDEDATPETVVAALAALLDEDEPDRDRIAARAGALLGAGEPGLPEETFWAVRRLVENTARVRPVVMFFDDIHWAEPLLLDFVDYLVEWIRDAPVLLVSTARPEVREVRPALVEEGGRVSAVIHLEGLPVEESRRLACELLGAEALPEPLLERLTAASEGNPLFVGELVRMLVDDGVLRRQGETWVATVDLQEIELPLTIHALLGARIDRLTAGERAVLEVASVIGKTFYRGAVAELVAPEARADLDALLEQLRRKELIDSAGTYWIDEPVLRFHHVLIRDAAYRRLLKESRAELHERAAQWLADKVGELVEHDDIIGYQLERAYELRFEAGEISRGLGRQAAARLAAAGRRALEADDRLAAASLLGRAIECLDTDDPDRAQLLIDQCEALLAAGDVNAAIPTVASLESIAEGSARLEAWAECFAGELANMTDPGHLADTAARVAAAAARLASLGDVAGEAKARSVQAASLMRLGRIAECEATLDKALAAARQAGDRRRATGALAGVPVAVLWGPNSVTRASGRCLDVVRVLRITSRAPAVEATSLRCQAVLESLRGRVDAGRRMLATARASLEELGNAHGLLELDLAAGMVETIAGDLDAAESHLRRAHDGFASLGIDVDTGLAAALLARVAVARAAFDDAVELTIESEKRGGDDLKTAIAWRAVRAEALAHAGQLGEARALAEEAVALAEPTDALIDQADALMAMATVMRVSRDDRAAGTYAQRALELYDRKEASALAQRVRDFLGDADLPSAPLEESAIEVARLWPENTAIRTLKRSQEVSHARDWDAYAGLVAEGAIYEDRRPVLSFATEGRDAFIDVNRKRPDVVSEFDVRLEPLLTRGERLALVHGILLAEGDSPEAEIIQLVEVDERSRLTTMFLYDADQIHDATAELDRRYAANSPYPDVWEPASLYLRAINTRDWKLLRAVLPDNFVGIDHRPVGWDTADADQFVGLYRSAVELAPDALVSFVAIHAISPEGACVAAELRGTTVDGGQFRNPATVVFFARDQQFRRCDFYPDDEPERGTALLAGRELGAVALENDASRVAFSVTGYQGSVVGVRGRNLCLLHSIVGTNEVLEVVEIDADGRVAGGERFDCGQLDEAFALLDERFVAGEARQNASAWSVTVGLLRGESDHDMARALSYTADDMTFEDHRPLGWGPLSRMEWAQLYPPVFEQSPDVTWRIIADCDLGARVAFVRFEMRGTRTDGGEFVSPMFGLFEVVGGLCRRIDIYALEDAADTEERFAQLASAEVVLENEASRVGAATIARMFEEDWHGLAQLFAEDVVIRDHRPLVGGADVVGRTAATNGLRTLVELGVTEFRHRVFAVRGERLCLTHSTVKAGEAGDEVLELDELDEHGREIRSDTFACDQIDEAFALLDERFLAGEGAEHAAQWKVLTEVADAMNTRDLEAIRRRVTPDFRMVDHRSASLGSASLLEWFEMFPPLYERSDDVRWWTLADCALSEHAVLRIHESRGTTREGGGEFSSTYFVVSEFRGGAPCRNDFYALEEAAAAKARFAEIDDAGLGLENAATRAAADSDVIAIRGEQFCLVRVPDGLQLIETDDSGKVARTASFDLEHLDDAIELLDERFLEHLPAEGGGWRAKARAVRAMNARDLDALRATMTEDLVFIDHRPLSFGTIDREGYMAVYPPLYEMSPDVRWTMVRDIAVADHAACYVFQIEGTTNDGGRFSVLPWVVASDRDGLLAHMEAFTTADEAIERFDELVNTESGQTLANAATRAALAPHEVLAIRGNRLALTRSRVEPESREVLQLTELDEQGTLAHSEVFELGQLDEATELLEARFLAELGEAGDAWHSLLRVASALNRRSLSDLRDSMTEDFDIVDHRPLSFGTVPRDEYLGTFPPMWDQSPDVRVAILRDLGMAGHVICFSIRIHGTTNDGGLFDNFLWMVAVERDGRFAHMEDFATREEALERFAELASAPSDRLTNTASRVHDAFGAAFVRGDFEGISALLADDVVLLDARPLLGLETVGKDEALRAIKTIREVGGTEARWEHLAVRGDRLALSRLVISGTGGEVEVVQAQELDADGRLCRWSTYEVDQLNDAFADLEERFLAELGERGGGWAALVRAVDAMNRRDLEGLRASMTEDLQLVDRRPLSFGTVDRDEYVGSFAPIWEQSDDVRWTLIRDEAVTEHTVAFMRLLHGTTTYGGGFDSVIWNIAVERDGLVALIEDFATREEALERFAELTAGMP